MASLNDFKILNKKCLFYFNLLEAELGRKIETTEAFSKERIGFYVYALQCICKLKEIKSVIDLITDTNFHRIVYGKRMQDCGVDAIYIDEDRHYINLFNFAFRNQFNPTRQQQEGKAADSSKFLQAIYLDNTKHLQGEMKKKADKILDLVLNSTQDWKLRLYVVSNENAPLSKKDPTIKNLEAYYDLVVEPVGLDKISEYMSFRPKPINAFLAVKPENVMQYSEASLSSNISYILKISLQELIRISCNDKDLRENEKEVDDTLKLCSTNFEPNVLYDNVRGFLGLTRYNKKIVKTLETEPEKFFMYNNGITIVAKTLDGDIRNKKFNGGIFTLKIGDYQVVNGGQTLRTIHDFNSKDPKNLENFLSKGSILVRFFKSGSSDGSINKIAEYTNSQNAISIIDLKSLAQEQMQIEQYLDEHNILYLRKEGETGKEEKEYKHRITIEKFAQLLHSLNGNPEKASNKKKAIFEFHYDETFKDNFIIDNSPQIIERYDEIKGKYKKLSDQKIFYILYLDQFFNSDIEKELQFLEKNVVAFNKAEDKEDKESRVLIKTKFKEFLDQKLKKSRK